MCKSPPAIFPIHPEETQYNWKTLVRGNRLRRAVEFCDPYWGTDASGSPYGVHRTIVLKSGPNWEIGFSRST